MAHQHGMLRCHEEQPRYSPDIGANAGLGAGIPTRKSKLGITSTRLHATYIFSSVGQFAV